MIVNILCYKSLFGAVKLTKNTDHNKYKYSCYGIGFDTRVNFSLSDGSEYEFNYFRYLYIPSTRQKQARSVWKTCQNIKKS